MKLARIPVLGFGNDRTPSPPVAAATPVRERDPWQFSARILLSLALLGTAVFMLWNYERALIWALVLAIALWPLFERACARAPRLKGEVLPLVFTGIVCFVFLLPFALLAIEAAREFHQFLDYAKNAENNGLPTPDFIARLPHGQQIGAWWREHLSHAGWAKEYLDKLDKGSAEELGKTVGRDALHRVILFGFCLLALFFLFKEGDAVTRQCKRASAKLFGPRGERIGKQMVASVHGTVNGLVLVGIGEGVLLGVVYAFTKVPHSILFGAFTAVAAMIPFAAAIAFCLAALAVLATGSVAQAAIIVVAGFIVTFSADHFVRPKLIGGATKLPFIWVLLGILGGVETFRLLGLFLGPAIMAALILLWRELADAEGQAEAAP